MVVSNRAVVAAIPLRHLNHARRAVNVSWRILDGSARAGRDYAGPASGVEPFIEGNSFRILYVPILPNAGATPDRSFTVELTGASDGADARAHAAHRGHDPRVDLSAVSAGCGSVTPRSRAIGTAFAGRETWSSASMRAGIAFSTVSRSASGTGADSR